MQRLLALDLEQVAAPARPRSAARSPPAGSGSLGARRARRGRRRARSARRAGSRARAARPPAPLFAGRRRSAAEHRAAPSGAAAGAWAEAVRERLRAIVRDLEERGVARRAARPHRRRGRRATPGARCRAGRRRPARAAPHCSTTSGTAAAPPTADDVRPRCATLDDAVAAARPARRWPTRPAGGGAADDRSTSASPARRRTPDGPRRRLRADRGLLVVGARSSLLAVLAASPCARAAARPAASTPTPSSPTGPRAVAAGAARPGRRRASGCDAPRPPRRRCAPDAGRDPARRADRARSATGMLERSARTSPRRTGAPSTPDGRADGVAPLDLDPRPRAASGDEVPAGCDWPARAGGRRRRRVRATSPTRSTRRRATPAVAATRRGGADGADAGTRSVDRSSAGAAVHQRAARRGGQRRARRSALLGRAHDRSSGTLPVGRRPAAVRGGRPTRSRDLVPPWVRLGGPAAGSRSSWSLALVARPPARAAWSPSRCPSSSAPPRPPRAGPGSTAGPGPRPPRPTRCARGPRPARAARLGLPRTRRPADVVVAAVAARTGRDPAEVAALLYGRGTHRDDAALVPARRRARPTRDREVRRRVTDPPAPRPLPTRTGRAERPARDAHARPAPARALLALRAEVAQGRRRPGRRRHRPGHRAALPRPRAARGRPGRRQDAAGAHPRRGARPGHQARAVHPGPDARRRHRLAGLRRPHRRVLVPPGPGLHQPAARRRDQPDAAEDAGRRCSRRWRSGRSRVDGTPRPLPDPFIVAATQNPVEYEGTYPLPEAQLDRFLLKLTRAAARRATRRSAVLRRHAAGFDPRDLAGGRRPAGGRRAPTWPPARPAVRRVSGRARGARLHRRPVPGHPDARRRCALGRLARAARPRCWRTARAWAWLSGRDYVTPDDVKALARPDPAAPGAAAARGRARGRHRRRACSTACSRPSPSRADAAMRDHRTAARSLPARSSLVAPRAAASSAPVRASPLLRRSTSRCCCSPCARRGAGRLAVAPRRSTRAATVASGSASRRRST